MFDQLRRDVQNPLGTAIVTLQTNDVDVGVIVFEVEDVIEIRSAPAIDRLIRIARHAEVRMVDRHSPGDGILGQVRVLVFIDKHKTIAFVERLPDFVVFTQHSCDVVQQVIEIDRVRREQPGLISRVDDLDNIANREPRAWLISRGTDKVDLGPTDGLGDRLGRCEGRINLGLPNSSPQGLITIARIVVRVIRFQSNERRIAPEQSSAETIECAKPKRSPSGRQPCTASEPHFLGRFVRERER